MTAQAAHLARVTSSIGDIVLAFCRARRGRRFHAADLCAYVADRANVAPDSPGRVLRDLRRRGLVCVELVDRAASMYRVVGARK